jgi:DNA-directed RNA polymerase subunit H (RpoH/RPB5)
MDTEEYNSDSEPFDDQQSDGSDGNNNSSDDDDEISDEEGADYHLREEQDHRNIELDDENIDESGDHKGKGDVKQSVITRSTKQAFVNYLQRVSKPNSSASSSAQKIMTVVHQLIQARGFAILKNPPPPEHNHLKALVSCKKRTVVGTNGDNIICVFFDKTGKLGVQTAREIEHNINKFKITQVVVVTTDGVTPVAMKSLLQLSCLIHFFQTKELMKKYTDHALIPDQRRLSAEEGKRLLTKHQTTLEKMPRMSSWDPIAKFYGWAPRDIIESVRQMGGSTEPYYYYRAII